MSYFSNKQKIKCMLWLAETNDIPAVQKKFQQEYCTSSTNVTDLDPQFPSSDEINKWHANFMKAVSDGQGCNKANHGIVEKENSVDLHTTIFEKETGLLNFFGFRKFHRCHPFKMHLNGKLEKEDFVNRKKFAETELGRIELYCPLWDKPVQFLHRIWFGGEAKFYTNGRVECHNVIYMADNPENPESKIPPPRTNSYVTVFAVMNAEVIFGPYITTGKVDNNTYKLYLKKFVYELQQIRRIQNRLYDPIFMHDDSSLHEGANTFLEEQFPNYWIGPRSPHGTWPRMSPDMNPLCFFLWGHIKNKVYETPFTDNDTTELGNRIQHAFTELHPDMLEEAVKAYKERLKLVVKQDGGLVDVHDDDENVTKQQDCEAIELMEW